VAIAPPSKPPCPASISTYSLGIFIAGFVAQPCKNIVQAISRDLLAHSMKILKERKIVGSVHDELIIESNIDDSVEEVCNEMAIVPDWAHGLVLKADGYECMYYKKE
jgi:hypothetical protein